MTGSMATVVPGNTANPVVNPSSVSAMDSAIDIAVDSTDLQAQSIDPSTPCDLPINEATCFPEEDDPINTTNAGFHPEGVLSCSSAPSHLAVDPPPRSHGHDEVTMETDLLESLLPSPTMDRNPAMEDDLPPDALDMSPCETASPEAVSSPPCRTVPTLRSPTAAPDRPQELAKRLTDQLIQHHGCCSDCHRQGQEEHEEEHE